MKILECGEGNNNSYFLVEIINNMNIDKSKYKWIISDLDLVPIFDGDYSGIGGEAPQNVAYNFLTKMEQEKIAILDNEELFRILEFTRTIRDGVFICLEKQYSVDIDTYSPRVEGDKPEEMYDNRAECEIRIFDGELFFILNN